MIKRVEIVVTAPGLDNVDRRLDGLLAKLKLLNNFKLEIKATADISGAIADLGKLDAATKAMAARPLTINVTADTSAAVAKMAAMRAAAASSGLAAGAAFAAGFATGSAGAGAGGGRGGASSSGSGAGGGFLGGLLGAMGMGGGRGRGAFGWAAVPLFGGIGSIGAFHLLADAILETAATLIPATLAMAAFGFAGTDAAMTVYNHFTDLHTVMDATRQSVYPMTGAMEALHRAVTPSVYQLLGDALTVMNSKTGEFAAIAMGAGHALDYLFARATVALKSAGTSSFMANAVQDLFKWGTALGNIFGIIGNILRTLPGYANILLNVLDGVTHGIEVLTATPVVQWALRAGLAFHGFAIYAGLAATGVMMLVPWAGRLISAFAGAGAASTALRDLGTSASSIQKSAGKVSIFDKFKAGFQDITQNTPVVIGRLKGIGAAAGTGAGKVSLLARAGELLVSGIKWGIVAAAFVGTISEITGAVSGLHNLNNATAQWIRTLQTGLQNTALPNLLPQMNADIRSIQDAMDHASKSFIIPHPGFSLANLFNGAGLVSQWDTLMSHIGIGVSKFGELHAALQGIEQQRGQFQAFIAPLAQQFGGTAQAMTVMNMSGITSKQVLDAMGAAAHGNLQPLLILRQEVEATAQAYQAMGARGGVLGNDLQMLDAQTTDQYKAVQTLNQGWDTFTTNMTNTQNTFDTFALGMKTLGSSATSITHHLGDSQLSINGLGHAIDGLSKKDLALNQAFTQQVVNSNALIDTWRQAGLAGNIFQGGVKGLIAQLLPFARGSQEATAQLVGLAQEAGYDGPAAFSKLSQWLGNTHGSLLKVKEAANQATIQEALLTTSMRDQGSYIANQLIGDINQATLKYFGVQKAAEAYGNAVAKDGVQSDAARTARLRLINDLIASGKAAGETTRQIAAMITKVTGIPTHRAIQIVEHGTGSFSVTNLGGGRSITSTGQVRGGGGHTMAFGGMVRGGVPHRDSVLSLLTPGEVVIPEHMVRAGAVDHLRGKLPHFAAGGLVQTGNLGVLSGQAAVSYNQSFTSALTSAMESAMRSATMAAMAAAFVGGAPAYGSSSAAMRFAQGLLRSYGWGAQWPSLYSLWERESGWNPYAVNPSSGAYGIPQALGHGHPFNLGDYANQIRWGLAYIRGRYGDPANAWAHELSFGWYDRGGQLKPGWTLALNTTGHNEMVSSARGYGTGGAGGDIFNITVQGDTNPDAAALRIVQLLRDYKRHHGGQPTGTG